MFVQGYTKLYAKYTTRIYHAIVK